MDIPSAFYVDARQGKIAHIGGDQLNLSIHIPRAPSEAPSSSVMPYPWKVLSGLYDIVVATVFRRYDALVGLRTYSVVLMLIMQQGSEQPHSRHTLYCN